MTIEVGSTLPRRQLGRYLRQLREEARMTVKAAAESLGWSPPKIWRIESGVTSMRSPDVEAMCGVYRASPELTEALAGLAKETRGRGWWHSYGDAIPEWFELYVGLESATTRLRTYEPQLIPGLLQTRAYATRVFEVGRRYTNPAEIERRVSVRLERHALLTRIIPRAPQVDFVLDESTLRRRSPAARAARARCRPNPAEQPVINHTRSRSDIRYRPVSGGSDETPDAPARGLNRSGSAGFRSQGRRP